MPTRDAERTRARILAAATTEFAAHGLAGGRIERIAHRAEVNVRMIYAYFGDKAGLFDAAVAEALRDLADAVPPDPADPAGWALALFDHHLADPTALQLAIRAQLERPEAATEPAEVYRQKVAAFEEVAAAPLGAGDLVAFVYALAQTWALTPIGLLGAEGRGANDPERIRAHRAALGVAVTRLVGR